MYLKKREQQEYAPEFTKAADDFSGFFFLNVVKFFKLIENYFLIIPVVYNARDALKLNYCSKQCVRNA